MQTSTTEKDSIIKQLEFSNKENFKKLKMQIKINEENIIIIKYLEGKITLLQEELDRAYCDGD